MTTDLHPYDPVNTARQPTHHGGGGTIEDAAHRFLTNVLDGLNDPEERGGVYDVDRSRCRRYMVAGNGPSAWFYVIFDAEDPTGIDEIFLLYSEGTGAAVRVPAQYHLGLFKALEQDRRDLEAHR